MTFPVCGSPSSCQVDEKNQINPPSERMREDIRNDYQCPCNGVSDISFRSRRNTAPSIADQSLAYIESVLNNDVYAEFNKASGRPANQSKFLECPWWAFQDPIWIEVRKVIQLKEHAGKSIDERTDNLLYDAYLYYSECAAKVDYYVKKKEFDKRQDELNKRK